MRWLYKINRNITFLFYVTDFTIQFVSVKLYSKNKTMYIFIYVCAEEARIAYMFLFITEQEALKLSTPC